MKQPNSSQCTAPLSVASVFAAARARGAVLERRLAAVVGRERGAEAVSREEEVAHLQAAKRRAGGRKSVWIKVSIILKVAPPLKTERVELPDLRVETAIRIFIFVDFYCTLIWVGFAL
jgi:hypothetical protein